MKKEITNGTYGETEEPHQVFCRCNTCIDKFIQNIGEPKNDVFTKEQQSDLEMLFLFGKKLQNGISQNEYDNFEVLREKIRKMLHL